jgi:hypothetical protein
LKKYVKGEFGGYKVGIHNTDIHENLKYDSAIGNINKRVWAAKPSWIQPTNERKTSAILNDVYQQTAV